VSRSRNEPGVGTSPSDPLAESVSFDADSMWVALADGRKFGVPLAYFPRLLHATPKQRERYVSDGGGGWAGWCVRREPPLGGAAMVD
jgi:hypothetical protein